MEVWSKYGRGMVEVEVIHVSASEDTLYSMQVPRAHGQVSEGDISTNYIVIANRKFGQRNE